MPDNSTTSVEVLSIKDNSTLTSGATTLTKCNKELRLVRGRLCAMDVLDVPAANQHHQQQKTSTITTRTSGDNLTSSVGTFTIPAGKSVTYIFTTSAGKSGTSVFTTYAGKNAALKECQYKRGGWCLKHNKKGTKGMLVSKVREKLKTGLWGFVLKRKVTYQCGTRLFDGDFSGLSTAMDELGCSDSKGLIEGTFENFTGAKHVPGLKRLGDSLEPRPVVKRARL